MVREITANVCSQVPSESKGAHDLHMSIIGIDFYLYDFYLYDCSRVQYAAIHSGSSLCVHCVAWEALARHSSENLEKEGNFGLLYSTSNQQPGLNVNRRATALRSREGQSEKSLHGLIGVDRTLFCGSVGKKLKSV